LILITGGAGFIGPKLAEQLIRQGEMLRIFDNLSTGSLSNISGLVKTGGVEFINGDIRDAKAVAGVAKGCDLIYHLAAQSSVPVSTKDPRLDMSINIDGTFNILEAAKAGSARVVFASSSTVYGNAARTPTPEDEALIPYSFYGL